MSSDFRSFISLTSEIEPASRHLDRTDITELIVYVFLGVQDEMATTRNRDLAPQ